MIVSAVASFFRSMIGWIAAAVTCNLFSDAKAVDLTLSASYLLSTKACTLIALVAKILAVNCRITSKTWESINKIVWSISKSTFTVWSSLGNVKYLASVLLIFVPCNAGGLPATLGKFGKIVSKDNLI